MTYISDRISAKLQGPVCDNISSSLYAHLKGEFLSEMSKKIIHQVQTHFKRSHVETPERPDVSPDAPRLQGGKWFTRMAARDLCCGHLPSPFKLITSGTSSLPPRLLPATRPPPSLHPPPPPSLPTRGPPRLLPSPCLPRMMSLDLTTCILNVPSAGNFVDFSVLFPKFLEIHTPLLNSVLRILRSLLIYIPVWYILISYTPAYFLILMYVETLYPCLIYKVAINIYPCLIYV